MADIVYVVREGDDNDELRYSLRSLSNLTYGQVWLVGYQPTWTSNVGRLEVAQHRDKYRAVLGNLRAAAECGDIANSFLLFNDDFFCMEPTETVEPHHLGPLPDVARRYEHRSDEYAKLVRRVARRWPSGMFYGAHVPMPMRRDLLLETLASKPVMLRTCYGNQHQVGGTRIDDVKIKNRQREPQYGRWLSTSDASFSKGKVGKMIRSAFPDPCKYEREGAT